MGHFKGASVMLEQKLGKDILYLPCRHHIYEVVLRGVFKEKVSKSSGPNIPLFKKFQQAWPNINKTNFVPGVKDRVVKKALKDTTSTLTFAQKSLQQDRQPREDYRELLELLVCFLGGTPPRGIFFRIPGAFHQARWMAKAIYCIKMFLFREEFDLVLRPALSFLYRSNTKKRICLTICPVLVPTGFELIRDLRLRCSIKRFLRL